MKATIPIAITPGTRVLRLERQQPEFTWRCSVCQVKQDDDMNPANGYWQLWIHANRDITQGTVLRLYDDGRIDNITIDEDGIERLNFRVKDADK